MIETVLALSFESAFTGLEDDAAFHALVAGLAESLRALLLREVFMRVVAWPRLVDLQVVLEEHLIDVEPGGRGFEAHSLPSHQLQVFGACLLRPRLLVVQVSNFVLHTEHYFVVDVHLILIHILVSSVTHDHSCSTLRVLLREDLHVRCVGRIV